MLLCIDISNSTIKAGVFNHDQLISFWQFATERHKVVDDYAMLLLNLLSSSNISPKEITDVSFSCVVPQLKPVFKRISIRYLNIDPFIVSPSVNLGITLNHDYPIEVGGLHRLYGGPIIGIALGTATVFDCVSKEGVYLGGAIAPGIIGALESLTSKASQLFKVELVRPPNAIGTNTLYAMQSGIVFGFVGLVEGLVNQLKSEMVNSAIDEKIKVVATGGLVEVIQSETEIVDFVDQHLTLNGLRLLYRLNT